VALGTCIEYQNTGDLLTEDKTPLAPSSTYARCKHELHDHLRSHLSEQHVPLTWARIFYPYGEREHPARLVSSLLARLRSGETIELKTPKSVKDYIHVEDVASALLKLARARFDGAVNVGTGVGVTVETIARRLAELIGRSELIKFPETPPYDPFDFVVADVTRIQALGWNPQIPLENGLKRLATVNLS
jgi:dTDP-6-deoxy-L-talose 4-dehydrogenase (NAD+)